MACDKPKKTAFNEKNSVGKTSSPTEETKPKTITLKEISRIALVEANQFLKNAKQENLDFSAIMPIYEKAQKSYNQGDYKQAQITAVKVRQLIERLLSNR